MITHSSKKRLVLLTMGLTFASSIQLGCRLKSSKSDDSSLSNAEQDDLANQQVGQAVLDSGEFLDSMKVAVDALKDAPAIKSALAGANGAAVQTALDNAVAKSEKLSAAQVIGVVESFLSDSTVSSGNAALKLDAIAALFDTLSAKENSAGFIGSIVSASEGGDAAIKAALAAYTANRSAETATAVLQAIWDQVKGDPAAVREKYPINALLMFLASSTATEGKDSVNNTTSVLSTVDEATVGDDSATEEQHNGVSAITDLVNAVSSIQQALKAKSMDAALTTDIITAMAKAANQAGPGYAQQALVMTQRLAVGLIESGADLATIESAMKDAGEVLALRAKIAELSRAGADDANKEQIEKYLAQLNQLVARIDSALELAGAKTELTTLADTVSSGASGESISSALGTAKSSLITKIDDSFGSSGAAPSTGNETFSLDKTWGADGFMQLTPPTDVVPAGAIQKGAWPMLWNPKNVFFRQADGKQIMLWMVQYKFHEGNTGNWSSYLVAQRYSADWVLDTSYGNGGNQVLEHPCIAQVTPSQYVSIYMNFTGAKIQADGSFLIIANVWANYSANGGTHDQTLSDSVYNSGCNSNKPRSITLDVNGAIQGGGWIDRSSWLPATPSGGNPYSFQRMTKSNQGGYYLNFTRYDSNSNGIDANFTRIVKVNDDFSTITSWGNSGAVEFRGQPWSSNFVYEDATGKIYSLVAHRGAYNSSTNSEPMLPGTIHKFNSDGSVDTSWGTAGVVTLTENLAPMSLSFLAADDLVVSAGTHDNSSSVTKAWLYHFKSDGSINTTKNSSGVEIIAPTEGSDFNRVYLYATFKGLSGVNYMSGYEYYWNQSNSANNNIRPKQIIFRMIGSGIDPNFGQNGRATVNLALDANNYFSIHPMSYHVKNGRLFALSFNAISGGTTQQNFGRAAIVRFNNE